MAYFTRIVDGVLRSFSSSGGSLPDIYEETFVVPPGGITSGTPITLPNSGTYDSKELEVEFNTQPLEAGIDYDYVGSGSAKTQITLGFDVYEDERIQLRKVRDI